MSRRRTAIGRFVLTFWLGILFNGCCKSEPAQLVSCKLYTVRNRHVAIRARLGQASRDCGEAGEALWCDTLDQDCLLQTHV